MRGEGEGEGGKVEEGGGSAVSLKNHKAASVNLYKAIKLLLSLAHLYVLGVFVV